MTFRSLLLPALTVVFSTLSTQAQEAWLLEMPHKFSDYIIKKSLEGDADTVAGIIEKLPGLVAKKKIKEIERISWKKVGGKVHPSREITEGSRTFKVGARYYSNRGDDPISRKLRIAVPTGERRIDVTSHGFLGREWVPTFAHRGEELTVLLLERDENAKSAAVSLDHMRQLEYDVNDSKHSVAWYSADPLDGIDLGYTSEQAMAANPKVKFLTRMFTTVKKDGNSLLRMEAHSGDLSATETITLHHNEARFDGHSQLTGPLKKDIITVKSKSYDSQGEVGAWTLNLK